MLTSRASNDGIPGYHWILKHLAGKIMLFFWWKLVWRWHIDDINNRNTIRNVGNTWKKRHVNPSIFGGQCPITNGSMAEIEGPPCFGPLPRAESSGPPYLRRVPIGPVFTALGNPIRTERTGWDKTRMNLVLALGQLPNQNSQNCTLIIHTSRTVCIGAATAPFWQTGENLCKALQIG